MKFYRLFLIALTCINVYPNRRNSSVSRQIIPSRAEQSSGSEEAGTSAVLAPQPSFKDLLDRYPRKIHPEENPECIICLDDIKKPEDLFCPKHDIKHCLHKACLLKYAEKSGRVWKRYDEEDMSDEEATRENLPLFLRCPTCRTVFNSDDAWNATKLYVQNCGIIQECLGCRRRIDLDEPRIFQPEHDPSHMIHSRCLEHVFDYGTKHCPKCKIEYSPIELKLIQEKVDFDSKVKIALCAAVLLTPVLMVMLEVIKKINSI